MRKLLASLMLLVCMMEPAAANLEPRDRVCHKITDPDAFIKAAAAKSAAMTVTKAAEFGNAAGYKPPIIAAFILPGDETLVVVAADRECFADVHEDTDTWEAVQKYFGRGS